ncbi:MAG: hypothetical protein KVP17_005090 [Porospora cf. gigantea B]|uniref:uncharacterized protein n=1 Tax=Porospora cf. gigantea B TaxID=2853592 RepID=UPI003571C17C|nr:MAG: hypothetical protein KVP17_005090 [Porospora cf. gigantea B]
MPAQMRKLYDNIHSWFERHIWALWLLMFTSFAVVLGCVLAFLDSHDGWIDFACFAVLLAALLVCLAARGHLGAGCKPAPSPIVVIADQSYPQYPTCAPTYPPTYPVQAPPYAPQYATSPFAETEPRCQVV